LKNGLLERQQSIRGRSPASAIFIWMGVLRPFRVLVRRLPEEDLLPEVSEFMMRHSGMDKDDARLPASHLPSQPHLGILEPGITCRRTEILDTIPLLRARWHSQLRGGCLSGMIRCFAISESNGCRLSSQAPTGRCHDQADPGDYS
jgi:hypothetical protein